MTGNGSVDGVFSASKTAGTPNGVRCGAGKGTAHSFHFLPKGSQRTLGKPSCHLKNRIHAQRTGNGQQEAEGRTAVLTGKGGAEGDFLYGFYTVSVGKPRDTGSKGGKAVGGGFNIPIGFRADQCGWLIRKGGANQHTMCLGFGRNRVDIPVQFFGGDANIHGLQSCLNEVFQFFYRGAENFASANGPRNHEADGAAGAFFVGQCERRKLLGAVLGSDRQAEIP